MTRLASELALLSAVVVTVVRAAAAVPAASAVAPPPWPPHCTPPTAPHCQCPPHCSGGHPVPPPVSPPRPYEQLGSIDIGTYENTIFWWAKHTYVLENIPCTYEDHAGRWFPWFANHSYARIRDFDTGKLVANISSTVGFGFVNSFPVRCP